MDSPPMILGQDFQHKFSWDLHHLKPEQLFADPAINTENVVSLVDIEGQNGYTAQHQFNSYLQETQEIFGIQHEPLGWPTHDFNNPVLVHHHFAAPVIPVQTQANPRPDQTIPDPAQLYPTPAGSIPSIPAVPADDNDDYWIKIDNHERPFKCAACDKKYTKKNDTKRHYNQAHLGEKPYHCKYPDCPITVAQKGNLIAHYRSKAHNEGEDDKCGGCSKLLTSASMKRQHHLKCEAYRATLSEEDLYKLDNPKRKKRV